MDRQSGNIPPSRLNHLHRYVRYAFPPLLLGLSFPLCAQAYNLNAGNDVYTHGLNQARYSLDLKGNVTWNTRYNWTNSGPNTITIDGAGHTITGSNNALLRIDHNNTITLNIPNAIINGGGSNATLIQYAPNGNPSNTTINLSGSTLNNSKTAIDLTHGTVTLKASNGDITFNGNTQAINMAAETTLNLDTAAGRTIYLNDKITTASTGNLATINKTGAGKVQLSENSAVRANTNVNGGTFTISDNITYGDTAAGVLTVNSGTLQGKNNSTIKAAAIKLNGGITTLESDARLSVGGAFTQSAGATLDITLGNNTNPVINANTASLNGTLHIAGLSAGSLSATKTSELSNDQYTIIHTTNGITGNFSNVNLGGIISSVDYLTFAGGLSTDRKDYNVGFGLSWLAGTDKGHGTFTLGTGETFEVDLPLLTDQTGPFVSLWDGKSLTKKGDGTLILSAENTYSGDTNINDGTLSIGNGVTTGSVRGNINNQGALIFNRSDAISYAGKLSGTGSLTKLGAETLTLTGTGSTQGDILTSTGTLSFATVDEFQAASLTTATGATTNLTEDSSLLLSGTLTQHAGATLAVALGNISPLIAADSATLNGTLKITGIDIDTPRLKASDLTGTEYTIIHTTNGISGDFASVDLSGAVSTVDYLVVNVAKSSDQKDYNAKVRLSWLDENDAHGKFTLTDSSETFELDVGLTDQGILTRTTGWDGQSLHKSGDGTLIMSAANTYTGQTHHESGVIRTDIDHALQHSANVIIGSNATLDMNDKHQRLQHLSGDGSILLGTADLTVHNTTQDTTFDGTVSGDGSLIKDGSNALTLTGDNSHTGGTTITNGRLIGTHAGVFGTGTITNHDELELAFTSGEHTLNNQLSGTGNLIKTGAGTAVVQKTGLQGHIAVNDGTLKFDQNGDFETTSYTTASGATTEISTNATLKVNNHFDTAGTLSVAVGAQPVITADTATIAGAFILSGYSASAAANVTDLASQQFTVLETSAPGNLTGTFSSISLGGASSTVDYLSVTTRNNDGQRLTVGLGLNWYAAHSGTPQNAHGTFTLTGANEHFDIDAVLADEATNASTGWDGQSLTKAGAGTLQLSKQNTYTGATWIHNGTLRAGSTDIIANSSQVTIASGATLDLNSHDQQMNNVNGDGDILLGSASLTTNNTVDNTLNGVISGTGNVTKKGSGTLLLTADHTYTGTTTIATGTLLLGNGGSTGAVTGDIVNNGQLIINRSADYAYHNVISGNGDLIQQGNSNTLFSQAQTYTGRTDVNSGGVILLNQAQLTSTQPVTVAAGALLGGYGGVGGDVINNGLLAVADAVPGFATSPTGTFTVGGHLTNSGEIRMASPLPASILEINGDYIGNNGLLTLSTVLGDDNSATDKLIVHGNTSGTTRVVINNSNGSGAQTINGIEIIHVDGQSNGQFTLDNRVVAGAYEYSLYQGLPNQWNGNWYLRSAGPDGAMQWRPESGAYLGNQSLTNVMQMHTLYDREGAQFNQGNGSVWVRVTGGQIDSKAANGQIDMDSDYTLVQFGGDLLTFGDGKQRLQIGLMGSWGTGDTDTTGNRDLYGTRHTANGSVDGYSVGLYATWFADAATRQGIYVDSWFQYGWYDNDTTGQGMRTDSYDSELWTVSVEGGYTFLLSHENSDSQWRLTPQAQVAYSKYSADRLTDVTGTIIDGQNNDLWTARLGVRLVGQMQHNGHAIQPFAELNWWHSGNNASVTMDGMRVDEDAAKDRGELKVGLQGQFSKNWDGWLQVGWQGDFQDYQRLEGAAGIRYIW